MNPDNPAFIAQGWNIHRKRKALSALRVHLIKTGKTGHALAMMDPSQVSAFLSAGQASLIINDLAPEDLADMVQLASEFEASVIPKEKKGKAGTPQAPPPLASGDSRGDEPPGDQQPPDDEPEALVVDGRASVAPTMDEPPGSERPPFKHPLGVRETVVDREGTVHQLEEPMEPFTPENTGQAEGVPDDATERAIEMHKQGEPIPALPKSPTPVVTPEAAKEVTPEVVPARATPEAVKAPKPAPPVSSPVTVGGPANEAQPTMDERQRQKEEEWERRGKPMRFSDNEMLQATQMLQEVMMRLVNQAIGDAGAQINKGEISAAIDAAFHPLAQRIEALEKALSGEGLKALVKVAMMDALAR